MSATTTAYDKIIADTSAKYNLPPGMLHNLIQQESGFNPNAVSPAGAQGIAQFMPDTAKGMGINPLDPTQAIAGAGLYLSNNYKKFGNWPSALAAYNAGPGAVEKYGGVPPYKETQNYVKSILGNIPATQAAPSVGAPQSQQLQGPGDTFIRSIFPQVYAADNSRGVVSPLPNSSKLQKYEIVDNNTGETRTISLDHEPTAAEQAQAFKAPSTEYKPSTLNTILSTAGMVGGGIAGGAAAGPFGAIPAAGVGNVVGNQAADFIRRATGDTTVPPVTPTGLRNDAASGMATEAIGGVIGKTAGFLAHPIAPFLEKVNSILEKSPAKINVGEAKGLLEQFDKEIMPQFQKQGLGVEADAVRNALHVRVVNMVQALKKFIPAEQAGPGVDVNQLTLPIAAANEMKRNLYQLAQDSYGFIAKPEQEAIKQFARLTKNAIQTAEPGVGLPNAIASAMYKVPENIDALSTILSFGNRRAGQALQNIAGLPLKAVQKIIPKGGGYLNNVIPGAMSLINGLSGQNQ